MRLPYGAKKFRYSSGAEINLVLICYFLLATFLGIRAHTHCNYFKSKGYQTADCSEQKLKKVPDDLRSEIEVLDLSFNYIRNLPDDAFICCTSIKLLYLQSNSIYEIGSQTFSLLTNLMVLDLSSNVLSELPINLPNTIIRLYLDSNDKLKSELPISPLTSLGFLGLSSNKLAIFPSFNGSVVPSLIELNVTDNNFTNITADDLAPLCKLRVLFTDNLFPHSSHSYAQYCECLKFKRWTESHVIEVRSAKFLKCEREISSSDSTDLQCNVEPKNTTVATYERCLNEWRSRNFPYKLMVGGGITVVLVGAVILLYIRRRRKLQKKLENSSTNNHKTAATKKAYDSKLEDNHERVPVEEDKLLKQ